jgi:hypothetical protein
LCFACFADYTETTGCSCVDKSLKGNRRKESMEEDTSSETEPEELQMSRGIVVHSGPLVEYDTSSEADPEELREDMDDEVPTQPYNSEQISLESGAGNFMAEKAPHIEDEDKEPATQPQNDPATIPEEDKKSTLQLSAPKKKTKAKVAFERVSQKKIEALKVRVKEVIVLHGPLTFDAIVQRLRRSVLHLYKPVSKFNTVLRNFLANTKMGWLTFNGSMYGYDPLGVDRRPAITKDTVVQLTKDDKVCCATYNVTTTYFESLKPKLKPKTAKCALHAALRRNNGRNGFVYDFHVDAVPSAPAGTAMLHSAQDLVEFFS